MQECETSGRAFLPIEYYTSGASVGTGYVYRAPKLHKIIETIRQMDMIGLTDNAGHCANGL